MEKQKSIKISEELHRKLKQEALNEDIFLQELVEQKLGKDL